MKIGFVNIYSFRPHVEHLFYLSRLALQAGHKVSFLTCDASVDWCYAQGLKGSSRFNECPKCVLGGIRSFASNNVRSISTLATDSCTRAPEHLTLSSACTLLRTETDADQQTPELLSYRKRLSEPVQRVFNASHRWIAKDKLDAIVCFNGRMELTQAVIQAARDSGIPFLTHERTWFGDGLLLTPNDNCLALQETHRMVKAYRDLPLTITQARLAAMLVARRFSRENTLEWRAYNLNAERANWPGGTDGERYLVLPSSRNEVTGHADWESAWKDYTHALDDLISARALRADQLVVRCHPNWAEAIGRATGSRSFDAYARWCERRKIKCIAPHDKASTQDLIDQSDVVVLNGGSAAIEAGILGKKILSLGPANYMHAGIAGIAMGPQDLLDGNLFPDLPPRERIRLTLRFIYTSARRLPQFNEYVRPVTTTRYHYFDGADPSRIDYALSKGQLLPDDSSHAESDCEENEIIDALEKKAWHELTTYVPPVHDLKACSIRRRPGLRWVDAARGMFKLGDR